MQSLLLVGHAMRCHASHQHWCFLQVIELGPSCSGRVKKADRVVAVPWNGSRKGDGTWQQYALVEEANLVRTLNPTCTHAGMMYQCSAQLSNTADCLSSNAIQCHGHMMDSNSMSRCCAHGASVGRESASKPDRTLPADSSAGQCDR